MSDSPYPPYDALVDRCADLEAERDRLKGELLCRDRLIKEHLAQILHLENRLDAEARRAKLAERELCLCGEPACDGPRADCPVHGMSKAEAQLAEARGLLAEGIGPAEPRFSEEAIEEWALSGDRWAEKVRAFLTPRLAEHVCDYRCHSENGHHAWPKPTEEP